MVGKAGTRNALFEVAAQREPIPSDRQAFDALIEKYTAHGGQDDA
jgi:hypothetical protein